MVDAIMTATHQNQRQHTSSSLKSRGSRRRSRRNWKKSRRRRKRSQIRRMNNRMDRQTINLRVEAMEVLQTLEVKMNHRRRRLLKRMTRMVVRTTTRRTRARSKIKRQRATQILTTVVVKLQKKRMTLSSNNRPRPIKIQILNQMIIQRIHKTIPNNKKNSKLRIVRIRLKRIRIKNSRNRKAQMNRQVIRLVKRIQRKVLRVRPNRKTRSPRPRKDQHRLMADLVSRNNQDPAACKQLISKRKNKSSTSSIRVEPTHSPNPNRKKASSSKL